MTRPPRIAIAAYRGPVVRYFFQTDLLQRLVAQGVEVAVLARAAEVDELRAELPAEVAIHPLPQLPPAAKPATYLAMLRDHLHPGRLAHSEGIHGHKLRAVETARGKQVVRGLYRLARLLSCSRAARKAIPALERRFRRAPEIEDLLDRIRPDLLVTATTGFANYDMYLLAAAARLGVRSCVTVLSWDNITSKPFPIVTAEHAVAWGAQMKADLVAYNDFRAEQVRVCGVPTFDIYSRPDPAWDKAAFLAGLGLDPGRRTILVATGAPSLFPWNPNMVEALGAAMADGRLPDCQLAVRLHPIHHRTHRNGPGMQFQTLLDRYAEQAARLPNITVLSPRYVPGTDMTAPEDMHELYGLLRSCDVMVTYLSTMNLEAALLDRPIVNACFEGELMYDTAMRPRFDMASDLAAEHNQRVIDSGAVAMAYSPWQLVAQVRAALDEPGRNAEARRRLAAECGPAPGYAGIATADLLASLARDGAAR